MSILGNADPQELRKQSVWAKGHVIPDYDPNVWRRDDFGNPIRYGDYGDRNSDHGWEIDHIVPVERGGADTLSNLRPLQWSANVRR